MSRFSFWRALALICVLATATASHAATAYPPATGLNSGVLNGTLILRAGEGGATTARVSAQTVNVPWTVLSISQQIDDDSLDLLLVFRIDGGFPAGPIYSTDINLGVLPSSVKQVRFLTRTQADPARPVVQQAEAWVSEPCLMFAPALSLTATAYETIRVPLLASTAAAPVRPLRVITTPDTIDVYVDTGLPTDVCPASNSQATQNFEIQLSGRPAQSYSLRLLHYTGKIAAGLTFRVFDKGELINVRSLEFRPRGSYFLTANPTDVTTLLSLVGPSQEQLWTSADGGFKAWSATGDAPVTAVSVCRFFNQRASTHFYSARAEDCNALRGLPDWTDEGTAFRILLPQNGACQDGTSPVFRLFSAALSNHRYTIDTASYTTLISSGWVGEGIAFCSPNF